MLVALYITKFSEMNRHDLKVINCHESLGMVYPATKLLWHHVSSVPVNALLRGSIYWILAHFQHCSVDIFRHCSASYGRIKQYSIRAMRVADGRFENTTSDSITAVIACRCICCCLGSDKLDKSYRNNSYKSITRIRSW